jgi:hypothetical protein
MKETGFVVVLPTSWEHRVHVGKPKLFGQESSALLVGSEEILASGTIAADGPSFTIEGGVPWDKVAADLCFSLMPESFNLSQAYLKDGCGEFTYSYVTYKSLESHSVSAYLFVPPEQFETIKGFIRGGPAVSTSVQLNVSGLIRDGRRLVWPVTSAHALLVTHAQVTTVKRETRETAN